MLERNNSSKEVFIRVDTLVNDLQTSRPLAYRLMKEMNDELKNKGYITISGRVPRAYYQARFFGIDPQED